MVQLQKTAEALERLGFETEYSDKAVYPVPLLFRGFDVIHNFNFSMPWSKYQTWTAKKHRKPLVYSMIYHEGEQFVSYKDQQIMADATDAMIFLTEGEIARVERHLKIDRAKCHVIPNGVDPGWFSEPDTCPETGDFVLTVGRIEPSKGQKPTAEACKKLGVRYVMIGQRTDEAYARECEKLGAVHYPSMGPMQLINFYAACSVFVLASAAEVQPLVVMEAMAQGANVVLTDKCEWETPNVVRCKALDAASIFDALTIARARDVNAAGMREMESMTWEAVALKLQSIYTKLCAT